MITASRERDGRPTRCPGPALCRSCFWSRANGGRCPGCDAAYRSRCLKSACYFECDTCSGGRHAHTPGCCGRVAIRGGPQLQWVKDVLSRPVPEYSPPPLPISCRLIPVLYSQIRKQRIPECFPTIDAWAAPLHKVADRQGRFRSRDLKDYLGLPSDRKLILSTCAPDDYQEALWRRGASLGFEEHGIDYWFPGHFSIYDDDGRLYQFLNAKRRLLHAAETGSQFVWFGLGDSMPLDMLEPIRQASSVLFSSQQTFHRHYVKAVHEEIARADRWFPKETAFFVVGGGSPVPVGPDRVCYQVNSRWQILALKGRDVSNRPTPELPRSELLVNNLRDVLMRVSNNN